MLDVEDHVKVKIKIVDNKCPTPFACKKCIDACPAGIFMVAANPMKTSGKFKTIDENRPGDYMLLAPMLSKCIGCNLCVEICPNGAIKVRIKPPTIGDAQAT